MSVVVIVVRHTWSFFFSFIKSQIFSSFFLIFPHLFELYKYLSLRPQWWCGRSEAVTQMMTFMFYYKWQWGCDCVLCVNEQDERNSGRAMFIDLYSQRDPSTTTPHLQFLLFSSIFSASDAIRIHRKLSSTESHGRERSSSLSALYSGQMQQGFLWKLEKKIGRRMVDRD